MEYDDFEVRISPAGHGRLSIAAASEAGEASSEVMPQIGPAAAKRMRRDFREAVTRAREEPGKAASIAEELASMGRQLFTLLLPSELGVLWHRSGGIAAKGGKGIRIRIHLDLTRSEVVWLGTLPWELLYDEDSGGFLVLDGRTPVVRYLDVRQDRLPFPRVRPWRVLVVVSHPQGLPPLDVETERSQLVETWRGGDDIELIFPRSATFDDIRREIRRGPIHGIHYIGHALFDEDSGAGGLMLETASGRPLPLWGSGVADLIKGTLPPPALVVLNSCETARTSGEVGADPFGGAAAALMKGGVPAVVAMQLQIGNAEATHFSKIMYQALQDRCPVDRAVSEARLSLTKKFYDRPAWAIPSLFMRVADGRLFKNAEGSSPNVDPSQGVDVNAIAKGVEGGEIIVKGLDLSSDATGNWGPTKVKATIDDARDAKIKVTGVEKK